jgi:hypothetical protein
MDKARLGILCITPHNSVSTWIHLEAGAMARSLGRPFACPYLLNLDPSEIKGPLEHLQCTRANQHDTLRLIKAINDTLGGSKLEPDVLQDSFAAHWPVLQVTLEKIAREEKTARQVGGTDAIEVKPAIPVIEGEIYDELRRVRTDPPWMTALAGESAQLFPTPVATDPAQPMDLHGFSTEMLLGLLDQTHD